MKSQILAQSTITIFQLVDFWLNHISRFDPTLEKLQNQTDRMCIRSGLNKKCHKNSSGIKFVINELIISRYS